MPERVTPALAFRYLGGLIENLYALSQGKTENIMSNLIADPAVFDEIARNPDVFEKSFSLVGAFGASRFDANGPEWDIRRSLTQRLYAAAATPADQAATAETFASAFADDDAVTPERLPRTLLICSLRVFFRALGCTPDCEAVADLLTRMRGTVACLQYLSWQTHDAADLAAARADAADILSGFDAVFRADPTTRDLLIGFERQVADVPGFSATSELAVAVFAADTVNAAIGWAVDRLGTHSGVQERLFAELRPGAEATPYLDCFINETLRYFPAAPLTTRVVTRPVELAGRSYAAGDLLVLSIIGLHHNRAFWDKPEIFRASRAEFMTDSYDRRAFQPFLSGPRACGGIRLARMEVKAALTAFIRQYEVTRGDGPVRVAYGMTMQPATWNELSFSKR